MSDNSLTGSAEQETVQTGTEGTEKQVTETTEAKAEETKTADAEQPDKASADQSTDAPKPKRKSADERIAELTAKAHAARRMAADKDRQIQHLNDRLKSLETPAPRETDFQTFDQFQAAQVAHSVKQASKADRETDIKIATDEVKSAQSEAQAAQREAFLERASDFAERTPDFEQKTSDPTLPITTVMADEIHGSDKGPEIAYFLANNRAEAARIARLTDPREVARAIGRIEGRIGTPPPKKITTAPAPVKAVATGSGSKAGFDAHSASLSDMEAHLKRTGVLS